jgi:hypothetical protein
MTDPIRRALRTLLVLVVTMAGAVPALAAVFDVPAGTVAQVVAVFTFAGTLLTALLNHVEDTTSMPALLKAPASEGENPLPDPPVKKAAPRKAAAKKAR